VCGLFEAQADFFDYLKAGQQQKTDQKATQPRLRTHGGKPKWLSQHGYAGDSGQSQQRNAQYPKRGGRQWVP